MTKLVIRCMYVCIKQKSDQKQKKNIKTDEKN